MECGVQRPRIEIVILLLTSGYCLLTSWMLLYQRIGRNVKPKVQRKAGNKIP